MGDTSTIQKGQSHGFVLTTLALIAVLIVTRMIDPVSAFADTNSYEWTKQVDQDLLGGSYTSVASSSDGSHLITATTNGGQGSGDPSPLFVSDDSGANWTNVTPNVGYRDYWQSVGISSNGETMVAASNQEVDLGNSNVLPGQIFISYNAGSTWENITPTTGTEWQNVAISGDGNTVAAVANDETDSIYVSHNDGTTWTTTPPTQDVSYWSSLSVSDDGDKILVGGENQPTFLSLVDISDDGGNTWTDVSPYNNVTNAETTFATYATMSSNGDELAVGIYGYTTSAEFDPVYVSSDDGNSWTDVTPDAPNTDEWSAIALSGNGQSLVVGDGNNNTMFVSNDDGTDWNQEVPNVADESSNNWDAFAFNTDGSRLIAASPANEYLGYNSALDMTTTPTNQNTTTSQSATAVTNIKAPNTGFGSPADKTPALVRTAAALTLAVGIIVAPVSRRMLSRISYKK